MRGQGSFRVGRRMVLVLGAVFSILSQALPGLAAEAAGTSLSASPVAVRGLPAGFRAGSDAVVITSDSPQGMTVSGGIPIVNGQMCPLCAEHIKLVPGLKLLLEGGQVVKAGPNGATLRRDPEGKTLSLVEGEASLVIEE